MPARGAAALAGLLTLSALLAGCIGDEGGANVDLNEVQGLQVSVTPDSGDATTEFTFDATRTPGASGLNWTWDMGDGTTQHGPVVQHTFLYTNNLYRVRVTAAQDDQSLTGVVEVPVGSGQNALPTIELHGDRKWVAHKQVLQLHASTADGDGDPVQVEWFLSQDMGEGGGGHSHAPGEEHGHGAGGNSYTIPESTGQTGETAEFSFEESGKYRVVARAVDPKGGRGEATWDVKVTQTVPKTTFNYSQAETLHAGTPLPPGESVSMVLYELLQPSQNTFVDAARYDFRLLYPGSGNVTLAWDGSAAPADLDLYLYDEGGNVLVELAETDPTATSASGPVALGPGTYTFIVKNNAGAEVPFELDLVLALEVPGLTDVGSGEGADDGHDHEH